MNQPEPENVSSPKQTWLWVLASFLILASVAIGLVAFSWFKKSNVVQVSIPGGESITPIDLSAFYDKSGSWNTGNEWQEAPRGPVVLGGVPFEVNGLVRLSGRSAKNDNKPYRDEVKDIPVGRKFAKLHVLHIASYTTSQESAAYARISLRHADGTTTSWLLIYGQHGRDWHRPKYETPPELGDPNTKVVWRGAYTSGRTLRLFKSTFTNPKPGLEVTAIDLVSEHASPNASILSMSTGPAKLPISDPPSLPEPEAVYEGEIKITAVSAADGQPLSNMLVRINGSDVSGPFRTPDAVTDAKGQCVVKHPGDSTRTLTVVASGDGIALKTFRWNSRAADPIPVNHTFRVEKGVTVGGVVQDEAGQPVPGVKLALSALQSPAERTPYDQLPFSQVTVTNDAQGRWEFRSFPENFGSFTVVATHPDFVENRYISDGADRAYLGDRVELASLLKSQTVFKLRKGVIVAGRVLTEAGQPIAGARLLLGESRFVSNPIQARTDDQGEFRLAGAGLGSTYVTVQANGYAPECRPITVGPSLASLEFKLAAGRVLKAKVVDEAGRPVRTARITVDSWQNRQVLDLSGSTDSSGLVTIGSAPADGMFGSIYKSGYRSSGRLALVADDTEHTFTLRRALTITGNVVDADSKEPIERFEVTPGQPGGDQIYWQPYNMITGNKGNFSMRLNQDGVSALQIEADDHLPVILMLTNLTETHFEIELKKGSGPNGLVHTPDGLPAVGAQIAVMSQGRPVNLGAGRLMPFGSGEAKVSVANSNGAFTLRYYANVDKIIAVHPQGFAETSYSNFVSGGTLKLQRWGIIEGQLKVGPRLGTNESILLSPDNELRLNYEEFRVATDAQGRFVLTNVPPGERKLVRMIPVGDRSWGHSHTHNVTVKAGAVTTVTMGGNGRAVTGTLALSDPARSIDWVRSGHHSLNYYPKPPPFTRPEEFRAWQLKPETIQAQKNARSYTLLVREDGTFRVDDVLAGDYDLRIHLIEDNNYQSPVGILTTNVSVPVIENPVNAPPLDIGRIVVPLTSPTQRNSARR